MASSACEQRPEENEKDINDIFESIVLSEERFSKEGFQEGFRKGVLEGEIEGFHLGYHRGAEIGAEIGYYKGSVETLLEEKKDELSDKAIDALQKVLEAVNNFPTTNTADLDIVNQRDNVRARFKKACALLKLNCKFPEFDKLSF